MVSLRLTFCIFFLVAVCFTWRGLGLFFLYSLESIFASLVLLNIFRFTDHFF